LFKLKAEVPKGALAFFYESFCFYVKNITFEKYFFENNSKQLKKNEKLFLIQMVKSLVRNVYRCFQARFVSPAIHCNSH